LPVVAEQSETRDRAKRDDIPSAVRNERDKAKKGGRTRVMELGTRGFSSRAVDFSFDRINTGCRLYSVLRPLLRRRSTKLPVFFCFHSSQTIGPGEFCAFSDRFLSLAFCPVVHGSLYIASNGRVPKLRPNFQQRVPPSTLLLDTHSTLHLLHNPNNACPRSCCTHCLQDPPRPRSCVSLCALIQPRLVSLMPVFRSNLMTDTLIANSNVDE
jgi:hypothetical protein